MTDANPPSSPAVQHQQQDTPTPMQRAGKECADRPEVGLEASMWSETSQLTATSTPRHEQRKQTAPATTESPTPNAQRESKKRRLLSPGKERDLDEAAAGATRHPVDDQDTPRGRHTAEHSTQEPRGDTRDAEGDTSNLATADHPPPAYSTAPRHNQQNEEYAGASAASGTNASAQATVAALIRVMGQLANDIHAKSIEAVEEEAKYLPSQTDVAFLVSLAENVRAAYDNRMAMIWAAQKAAWFGSVPNAGQGTHPTQAMTAGTTTATAMSTPASGIHQLQTPASASDQTLDDPMEGVNTWEFALNNGQASQAEPAQDDAMSWGVLPGPSEVADHAPGLPAPHNPGPVAYMDVDGAFPVAGAMNAAQELAARRDSVENLATGLEELGALMNLPPATTTAAVPTQLTQLAQGSRLNAAHVPGAAATAQPTTQRDAARTTAGPTMQMAPTAAEIEDEQAVANIKVRMGITPKPQHGFPKFYTRDPGDRLRGTTPESRADWEAAPANQKCYGDVYKKAGVTMAEACAITGRYCEIIKEATGQDAGIIVEEPGQLEEGQDPKDAPWTWRLHGLLSRSCRILVTQGTWSFPDITVSFHPSDEPLLSRFLLAVMGCNQLDNKATHGWVKAAFLDSKIRDEIRKLVARNPAYEGAADKEPIVLGIIDTLAVNTRLTKTKGFGEVYVTRIYMNSPTQSGTKWLEFREYLREHGKLLGKRASIPYPDMRCEGCHGADHEYDDCDFHHLEKWQGPQPRKTTSQPVSAAQPHHQNAQAGPSSRGWSRGGGSFGSNASRGGFQGHQGAPWQQASGRGGPHRSQNRQNTPMLGRGGGGGSSSSGNNRGGSFGPHRGY